ncbi:dynamin family protein [Desulfococcus multivorans]|uniref:Dynamin family protein n=2 Tax=Desulfococcus TaxID=896 RepID=S7TLR3_DESML|nr:dynamin family protein [Desulfococcus multivorans]AOY59681.1 conserved uncharacterized protein [Desulfococcus multivorans]AQV01862.1 Dynamin family protein [Desulfococcus multivorans]EPR37831.1 Dynamin family protein [Desulfococcus multivorans DSM 2059]SKA17169.1 Dynamin family protein [Desulfococcus multivorans DSM 2059]
MHRENYINVLREEIVETVANHLTPSALKYGYSEIPLETNIKWRPMVLLIGNYSSGKSSLINEFLGAEIQDTGQAPTDDSFTVITYDETLADDAKIQVTEERDGKVLLNDPEYPFSTLRKQGQRFASHFRLKKCNSPFLKDLAIIDTPGMLDSITERDRGYDYQDVIGDLAQKAGLVLVLFDAHKAGTVREAYKSIRETLSAATFEDRIIFVLNRIDECTSFNDLLRVYGTLCWNLSQITGRKDIPMIRLTYSPNAAPKTVGAAGFRKAEYLPLLENQREDLRRAILDTPRRQLDHLASFVEVQGERLIHYMEALSEYREKRRKFRFQKILTGVLVSGLFGAVTAFSVLMLGIPDMILMGSAAGVGAAVFMIFWMSVVQKRQEAAFHQHIQTNIDTLTDVEDQTRKDSWEAVRELVRKHLAKGKGGYSLFELRRDLAILRQRTAQASQEIREAMGEVAALSDDEEADFDIPILSINEISKPVGLGDAYYENFRYTI